MRRLSRTFPLLAALLLGAACAVLVACGSSGGDDLIPDGQAQRMIDQLDTIQTAVDRGRCGGVGNDVAELQTQINGLSRQVDAGLRNRLQEGVNNLAAIAPDECLERAANQQTQTETTVTETTPTQTQTETTPTQTTTETVPTTPETTPTTPETTPTVPPETTPVEPGGATVPGDTGVGGATPETGTP